MVFLKANYLESAQVIPLANRWTDSVTNRRPGSVTNHRPDSEKEYRSFHLESQLSSRQINRLGSLRVHCRL